MNIVHPNLVNLLSSAIRARGGQAFIVGGYVRDTLLGIPSKDLDLECYGLAAEDLLAAVAPFGNVNLVGASFQVVKLRTEEGGEVDLSLPRRERKTGPRHASFETEADPYMDPKEACGRRDYTINAMMMNAENNQIHDYYDGEEHLRKRILKHTTLRFVEDPLRVLRGMQFAGRFKMRLALETCTLAREIIDTFKYLSNERIFTEFLKLAAKSEQPSLGLQALYDSGWIEHFPTLRRLRYDYIYESNIRALDNLVPLYHVFNITDEQERAILFFATMLRCFSTDTTALEEIRAYPDIIRRVRMLGYPWNGDISTSTLRRLAADLAPSTVREFFIMLRAHNLKFDITEALKTANSVGVLYGPEKALINGEHLQSVFGMKPGKELGTALKSIYRAQLNEEFSTESEGLAWVRYSGVLTDKTAQST